MDPINISTMSATQSLVEIAKMAFGSGSSEGVNGGAGNIGLINGHVVKFNTHIRERMSSTTTDMRASCNQLRQRLSEIAEELLTYNADCKFKLTEKIANRRDALIESIRKDLGMSKDGEKIESKGLLDRTVVAKVIQQIGKEIGQKFFSGISEMRKELSSDGINTRFKITQSIVHDEPISHQMVDDALAALEAPTENRKFSVKLTPEQTDFMKTLVLRERRALLAVGKPVPSAEDFKQSVLEGRSSALVATMLAFDRVSRPFCLFSGLGNVHETQGVYLAGAPQDEKLDRAELFMIACNKIKADDYFSLGSLALPLMCEKLKAMRDLQPHGRLKCETIWKACFDEKLPSKLKGTEGTTKFAEEMDEQACKEVEKILFMHLPELKKDERKFTEIINSLGSAFVTSAPTLDALVQSSLQKIHESQKIGKCDIEFPVPDLHYYFNPLSDTLARPNLYQPDRAEGVTDTTLVKELGGDFFRNKTIVRLVDGGDETLINLSDFKNIENLQERQDYLKANLLPKIEAFLGKHASHAQRNVVLLGLGQAGQQPLNGMFGVDGEHSDISITITRDPENADRVIMSYQTTETAPLDVRYAYAIDSDGTNVAHGDIQVSLFQRRSQPVEVNA